MIITKVFEVMDKIFDFKAYDLDVRNAMLDLRQNKYSQSKKIYVDEILSLLNISYQSKSFEEKQLLLRDAIGHVSFNQHPQFPELWVVRYISEEVAWEKIWNSFYEEARGTVINMETFEVINRTPKKFYNMGEEKLPVETVYEWCNDSPHIEFATKEDGSFISMGMYKNHLIVNTPGSFSSQEALTAYDLLLNDTKYLKLLEYIQENPDVTICGEFIHPDFPIVVNYHGRKDISLHMIVEKETGQVWLYSKVKELAEQLGVSSVNIEYNDLSLLNHRSADYVKGTEKEGWVGIIQKDNGEQLICKVKVEDYIDLHHYISKIRTPKYVLKYILNDTLDDMMAKIDNPVIKQEVADIASSIMKVVKEIRIQSIQEVKDYLNNIDFDTFKEFYWLKQQVYTHPLLREEFRMTKSDFNEITSTVQKNINHSLDKYNNKKIGDIVSEFNIMSKEFSLLDVMEEYNDKRFYQKVFKHLLWKVEHPTEHTTDYLLHKKAESIVECLDNELVSQLKDYKKEQNRWQFYLREMPKYLQKLSKLLYQNNFDFDKTKSSLKIEETTPHQLYALYKQDLLDSDIFMDYLMKNDSYVISSNDEAMDILSLLDKDKFITQHLIEANQQLLDIISSNKENYSAKKLYKEVRKIIYNETIDNSYEVSLRILEDIDYHEEKLSLYLKESKQKHYSVKSLTDITQYYLKDLRSISFRYDKQDFIERVTKEILKDKHKIAYLLYEQQKSTH